MNKDKQGLNKKLRDLYERITLPIGRCVAKTGLTPNQITVIAGLFGVIPLIFLYFGTFLYALIAFIFAVFLDVLDGSVARATDSVSKFGKVLDHTMDRYVEFFFILGLSLFGYINGWIGVFTIFGMIMPSYVRARGESECKVEGSGVGLFERKEKISLIVLGSLFYVLGYYKWLILNVTIFLVGLFSHITTIQRLIYFRRYCYDD
jgi:phosphatidylglycerophosphate synthase